MSVKELIAILQSVPNKNAIVRISSDGEGNSINDIHEIASDDTNYLSLTIWPK